MAHIGTVSRDDTSKTGGNAWAGYGRVPKGPQVIPGPGRFGWQGVAARLVQWPKAQQQRCRGPKHQVQRSNTKTWRKGALVTFQWKWRHWGSGALWILCVCLSCWSMLIFRVDLPCSSSMLIYVDVIPYWNRYILRVFENDTCGIDPHPRLVGESFTEVSWKQQLASIPRNPSQQCVYMVLPS